MVFTNRKQAGEILAERLSDYSNSDSLLVLAIPRGGVVVGAELKRKLQAELDVIVTKKMGAPNNPELAIGAVAEDGDPIFDKKLLDQLDIDSNYIKKATLKVHKVIKEYIWKFRKGRELDVEKKVVVVTDDGVATGSTVEAALSWLAKKKPAKIVLAIPVGARDSMDRLERLADETVCLDKPRWFTAVGQFYREFEQVSDEEVKKILAVS